MFIMKFVNHVNFLLLFCTILAVLDKVRSLDLGSKKFFLGKLFSDLTFTKKYEQIHKEIPALWFDQQKVNHFDPNDNRVWSQKYYLNRSFYQQGAPVFISLGGEGPLSNHDVTSSAVAEMGKKLNCFLITVEHRFYGESHPTNDTSVENLKLLTSQQALADFAEIIKFLRQTHRLTAGSSTACRMGQAMYFDDISWIRIRYPHLIYAAVASSAPVLAKFDFQEYFEKVGQTILETSPECYWTLNDAFTSMNSLLQLDTCCPSGNTLSSANKPSSILKQTFGLCKELNASDELEKGSFFSTLVSYWASVAQYNGVANGYILGGLSIDYLCQVMRTPLNASLPSVSKPTAKENKNEEEEEEAYEINSFLNSSVQKLGRLIFRLNKFYSRSCTQFSFGNMVDFLKEDQWTSTGVEYGMRQWIWQTCSEFAYFQTLTSYSQPFGHGYNKNNFTATCKLSYGEQYDETFTTNSVESANNVYGGKTQEGSRIIYVNGNNDPWSPLGYNQQNETNDNNLVISLQGRAHCFNAYQTLAGDTQDLIKVKEMILEKLHSYV